MKAALFSIDDVHGSPILCLKEGERVSLNHDVRHPILLSPQQAGKLGQFLLDFAFPGAEVERPTVPVGAGVKGGSEDMVWETKSDDPSIQGRGIRLALAGPGGLFLTAWVGSSMADLLLPAEAVSEMLAFLEEKRGRPAKVVPLQEQEEKPPTGTPIKAPETVEELVEFAETIANAFSSAMARKYEEGEDLPLLPEFPPEPWKDHPYSVDVGGSGVQENWSITDKCYVWDLYCGAASLRLDPEEIGDVFDVVGSYRSHEFPDIQIGRLYLKALLPEDSEAVLSIWREPGESAAVRIPFSTMRVLVELWKE